LSPISLRRSGALLLPPLSLSTTGCLLSPFLLVPPLTLAGMVSSPLLSGSESLDVLPMSTSRRTSGRCCLQAYGGWTTLRNKLESTVIQQTKINTCNVQTHLESTVIQQTKESESLCRSRTSTSVPTPRTDAPQAYRAATTHTGDRPSHTNNRRVLLLTLRSASLLAMLSSTRLGCSTTLTPRRG
jgi:hypothetical protein